MIIYDFNMSAKNADVKFTIQVLLDPVTPRDDEKRIIESLHRQMMDCRPITLLVGDKEYVFLPDSISQSAKHQR